MLDRNHGFSSPFLGNLFVYATNRFYCTPGFYQLQVVEIVQADPDRLLLITGDDRSIHKHTGDDKNRRKNIFRRTVDGVW